MTKPKQLQFDFSEVGVNTKKLHEMKIADFLALPVRAWNEVKAYDSLCVVNTRRKHDSGWGVIAIVGVNHNIPVEIAAYCDDICWYREQVVNYELPNLRTDMVYPSGVLHFWQRNARFEVGYNTSSTDVKVIHAEEE